MDGHLINQTALSGYRRAMAVRGRWVILRRVSGDAPNLARFDALVEAIITGYQSKPDVMSVPREGGITEGARQVLVIEADLAAAHWPLPVGKNDKVVLLGPAATAPGQPQATLPDGTPVYEIESLNVISADPYTRAIAGAVEIAAEGI
jgi:hypothetical protein